MPDAFEVNKTLLVVVALHALGGESDLERIAVKAHEMFPGQFCWKSFPQYPDKDAVRVHLSEAKKPSFGGLVSDVDLRRREGTTGGTTKRFALTRAGMSRAAEIAAQVDAANGRGQQVGGARRSLTYQRMVVPIQESSAFQRFVGGVSMTEIGRDAFLHAFKLFPDAATMVIVGRLNRAEAALAELSGRERDTLHRFISGGRDEFDF